MGLFSKIVCPVDPPTREWIDRRWRWLTDQFGHSRLRKARIILPTPQFFPDPYDGSPEDVEALLTRVAQYMEIDPATVDLKLYYEARPSYLDYHEGSAGVYYTEDGRFQIGIEVASLEKPEALVAVLAHELAHVLLLGHGRLTGDEDDHEPLTDLLTVFLGLGVFTANAVIQEKYWHEGHYAGWSIGRRGYLTMAMYGYAFALFARDREEDPPPWLNELRLDVRSACKEALRFLKSDTSQDPRWIAAASGEGTSPEPSTVATQVTDEADAEGTSDARKVCTFCGAAMPGEEALDPVSTPGEPLLGLCDACRESIRESEEESPETEPVPVSVQVMNTLVKVMICTLLGFLGFMLLYALLSHWFG